MKIFLAILSAMSVLDATAQAATGRVLVAVGVCDQSIAEQPIVWFRTVDKSANFNASGAAFGQWDYSDATGRFVLRTRELAAGEWEMYRHESRTKEPLGKASRHAPRTEYSHRFTVEPGKLVDLGRYCAATQSVGEKFPDSDRVWNQVARLVYMHVSPNREADVENARKPEGGGALLEVVRARPDPPERVWPTLRSRFVEPRVIAKPAMQQNPAPPTSPVN